MRTEGNCDIYREEFNRVLLSLRLHRVRNYSDEQREQVLEGCRLWVKYRSIEEEYTDEERRAFKIPHDWKMIPVFSWSEISEMITHHFYPPLPNPHIDPNDVPF